MLVFFSNLDHPHSGFTGLLCTACCFYFFSKSNSKLSYSKLEQDRAATYPEAGHKLLCIWIIIYESWFIKQMVIIKDIKAFCEQQRDCTIEIVEKEELPSPCVRSLFLCCFLLYGLTFLLIGCHVFTLSFCWSPSQVISPPLPAKASPSDP